MVEKNRKRLIRYGDLHAESQRRFDEKTLAEFMEVFAELFGERVFMGTQEWAEVFRELPEDAAKSGRMSFDLTPYLLEPASLLDSTAKEHAIIMVCKGAQTGFTELGISWIGKTIHQDPANIMLVQENHDKVKAVMKNRIIPMLQTPAFAGIITPKKVTQKEIPYPGGTLYTFGSHSPASFSSTAAAKAMLDEMARYEANIAGEGDALSLTLQRTATYGSRKKIYVPSTPVSKDEVEGSFITHWNRGDCRQYYIPCPACGDMDYLRRDRFNVVEVQENGQQVVTGMVDCKRCGEMFDEPAFKEQITAEKCEWRPTKKRDSYNITSYCAPSLIAPLGWKSWQEIAQELRDAERGGKTLQSVMNTAFGVPWNDEVETPPYQLVQDRWTTDREMGVVPPEVGFLTMAVDLQKGWMRWEVYGWRRNACASSVAAGQIDKDFTTDEGKEALDELIMAEWFKPNGALYTARVTCIDSGYYTQQVYEFVQRYQQPRLTTLGWQVNNSKVRGSRRSRTVIAVKGGNLSDPHKIIEGRSKIDRKASWEQPIHLHRIGTAIAKRQLYNALRYDPDQRDRYAAVDYPADYPVPYFKELVSERWEPGNSTKGRPSPGYFIKPTEKTRNEALDLYVYNYAGAVINGVHNTAEKTWDALINRKAAVNKKIKPQAAGDDDSGDNGGNPPPPGGGKRKRKRKFDTL